MKKRVLVSAGVVALLAGGVAAVAVAGPEFLAAPRADATDVAPFDYPVNDAGQTYGSLADAPSELLAPDLVLVRADDGREGYVRIEDLRAYEGEGVPSSPSEAAAWNEAAEARRAEMSPLTVYESDGATVIGEWTPSE
ncbi:hypothetical protein [Salana multivorans]